MTRTAYNVPRVTVSALRVVDGATDAFACGEGDFAISVEILLDLIGYCVTHFFTVGVYELYAVVTVWVVACRDHNSCVKVLALNYEGD